MRVLIQRVTTSKVEIEEKIIGEIGIGINILVGFSPTDTETEIQWMTKKCLNLGIFPSSADDDKKRQSVLDIKGEILVISQFTLYANCKKGRIPSYSNSANSKIAKPLYEKFVKKLRESNLTVKSGIFGADMKVLIENDGPVTIFLEK